MVAQIDRDYVSRAGAGATLRRAVSYALFEGRPATTRGQWFNPVVEANLRWGERLGGRPVDRPVFILGVGRSGTTHLGRLLSAHPDVGWLNEPKMLWHRTVPDEDVSGFYSPEGRFRLTADDATDDVRRRARRMFGHYLRSVRATRLVDKYPELTYRAGFLRALFPDARIVAIVRRPEDFVNSVLDWNRTHTVADEDWWGVDRRKWTQYVDQLVASDPEVSAVLEGLGRPPTEAEMAATEWIIGMRSISDSSLDLVLRYERLATEPVEAMREVLASCDLSVDKRVLTLARELTSSQLRHDPAEFGGLAEVIASTRNHLGV